MDEGLVHVVLAVHVLQQVLGKVLLVPALDAPRRLTYRVSIRQVLQIDLLSVARPQDL